MSDPSSTQSVAHAVRAGKRIYRKKRPPGMTKEQLVEYELAAAMPDGDCLITTAARKVKSPDAGARLGGYGQVGFGGKTYSLPRLVLECYLERELRLGEQANHVCHRRECINPEHLYAGSPRDNVRDMDAAGRRGRRAEHRKPSVNLNEKDVTAIRAMYKAKITPTKIAEVFGVTEVSINKIVACGGQS